MTIIISYTYKGIEWLIDRSGYCLRYKGFSSEIHRRNLGNIMQCNFPFFFSSAGTSVTARVSLTINMIIKQMTVIGKRGQCMIHYLTYF